MIQKFVPRHRKLIQRFGIKELPVDPFSIASNLNISIRPKPCNQEGGIAGALLRSGNDFGILYAHEYSQYRLPEIHGSA